MKVILTIILLFAFSFCTSAFAQTSISKEQLIKKFSGEWYNKKHKRQLVIRYNKENDYFIINDHTKNYSEDGYYAYPKGNKLIMPAQNEDHHTSYSEMRIVKNGLIYECNGALNFKDNFLVFDKFSTKMVFRKKRNE